MTTGSLGTILLLEDISMDLHQGVPAAHGEVASVAELAAGIAHEINNPLGIIQNYVELLKARQGRGLRDKTGEDRE